MPLTVFGLLLCALGALGIDMKAYCFGAVVIMMGLLFIWAGVTK